MAIYYVSTTGSNSADGSLGTPWLTPKYAATQVAAGDTVYFREGTYNAQTGDDQVMLVTTSGSDGSVITFANYNDEAVIFEATVSGTRRNYGIFINGANYITISGLSVITAKRAGIRLVGATNCTITDCTIHDIRDTAASASVAVIGIYGTGACHNTTIQYNTVYDCVRGISIANQGGAEVDSCLIDNNLVHTIHYYNASAVYNDANSDGIQVNTCTNTTISNNVIRQCGDDGIDCYLSTNCILEKNTIFNIGDVLSGTEAGSGGDGNGLKVSTGGGGGHLIRQNLCFNCERVGYDDSHDDSGADGNTWYNNIAYGNGRNGFFIEIASATDRVLKNNISYLNNQDDAGYTDIRVANEALAVSDYNLWGDGNNTDNEGTHTISGNPLFSNAPSPGINLGTSPAVETIRASNFGYVSGFELTSSSPCIDAGVDVSIVYLQLAPDIGRYESPYTAPTVSTTPSILIQQTLSSSNRPKQKYTDFIFSTESNGHTDTWVQIFDVAMPITQSPLIDIKASSSIRNNGNIVSFKKTNLKMYLQTNKLYKIRIKFKIDGQWSDWSTLTTFRTRSLDYKRVNTSAIEVINQAATETPTARGATVVNNNTSNVAYPTNRGSKVYGD